MSLNWVSQEKKGLNMGKNYRNPLITNENCLLTSSGNHF